MTCLIPLWLTLITLSPCEAWQRFQDDFAVASGHLYWSTLSVQPAHDADLVSPPAVDLWPHPDPYLGGLGHLIYEEVEGSNFIGAAGAVVQGEFVWSFGGTPRIRIAAEGTLRPGIHELQHWIVCVTHGRRSAACANIQHGTALDPFVSNLTRLRNGLFWPIPPTHSYFPHFQAAPPEADFIDSHFGGG